EIVDEYVRASDQSSAQREIRRLLEVQHHAALSAIEPGEVRRRPLRRGVVVPRGVAAIWAFDLDHVGAQIGKLTRAERRRHSLLHGDYAQSTERQRGVAQNDLGMPSTCSPM